LTNIKAVPTVELHCNQEFPRLAFSRLICQKILSALALITIFPNFYFSYFIFHLYLASHVFSFFSETCRCTLSKQCQLLSFHLILKQNKLPFLVWILLLLFADAGACLCNAAEQSHRFLILQHWLSLAERYRWLWNQRYPFMLDQPDAMIPSMLREIALRSCIAMQDYRRLWDSSVENGKCL
jgi:hypothetical protein